MPMMRRFAVSPLVFVLACGLAPLAEPTDGDNSDGLLLMHVPAPEDEQHPATDEHALDVLAVVETDAPHAGAPPECRSASECNDGNECTNDSCVSGRCENAAFDHSRSCAGGAGRCNGNISACCTTLSISCCRGCLLREAPDRIVCVDSCPGGMTCSPISVECY